MAEPLDPLQLRAKLARYEKLIDYCEMRLVTVGRMGEGESRDEVLRKTGANLKELRREVASIEGQLAQVQSEPARTTLSALKILATAKPEERSA